MKILTCVEFDSADPSVCVQEAWVEMPALVIPELPVSDGALLGGSIFGLLALAFLFRFLFREAERS